MHAFTEHGYICPDPLGFVAGPGKKGATAGNTTMMMAGEDETDAVQSGRRKPAYAGGLVLEPKKGCLLFLLILFYVFAYFTAILIIISL